MLKKLVIKAMFCVALLTSVTACNSNASANKAVAQASDTSGIKKVYVGVGDMPNPNDAEHLRNYLTKKLEKNPNIKMVPMTDADFWYLFNTHEPSWNEVVTATVFIDFKQKAHITSTGIILKKSLVQELDKGAAMFNEFLNGKL